MDILTVELRQIQRDKGKSVAVQIAAGEPVQVDTRAYIVPVSWLDIETDEPAKLCNELGSGMVQDRISANTPVPVRFGTSKETQAWLISLFWWNTMDKSEAFSD